MHKHIDTRGVWMQNGVGYTFKKNIKTILCNFT